MLAWSIQDNYRYLSARKNEPGVFILFLALIIERTHKRINPFVPNAPFFYPLKTTRGFQGVEKACMGNEWVNYSVSFRPV